MRRANVLLVEDDALVRQTLPALLEEEGHRVRTARNGEEGFRSLCTESADVVITDVAMPDVDGIDLIRLIRRDPFLQNVAIIAISARRTRLREAIDAGATTAFTKPIDHAALLAIVGQLAMRP